MSRWLTFISLSHTVFPRPLKKLILHHPKDNGADDGQDDSNSDKRKHNLVVIPLAPAFVLSPGFKSEFTTHFPHN